MMIWRAALAIALAPLTLAACTTTAGQHHAAANYPEATPFDANADAHFDVEAAFVEASGTGKKVLAIFGANWCHDSRALAGWLETPRFKSLTLAHFEVVYIDVGVPQTGNGRNMDIAKILGLNDIKGTPTLMVLSSGGKLLNADTAKSWRNTSMRSEDEIYAELEAFTRN